MLVELSHNRRSEGTKMKTNEPRNMLTWVTIGLAAVALMVAIYLTVKDSAGHNLVAYRVILLLLFFAISTVSALIFNTKASLGGSFWGLTLALGGPAVLWIVALVIFTRFYPESSLTTETSLQSKAQEFWTAQQKIGWQDYETWKTNNNDDFQDILGVSETDTLRNLFWSVHYRTPGARLDSVQIATVFLYFGPKFTMKFQRIRGNRAYANGKAFRLHYGAQTSNSTGGSGSVLLVARPGDYLHLRGSYYDGDSTPDQYLDETDIDCLIVSWYQDEVSDDGDYLTADLKEFATNHRASYRLGIAAFKPIEEAESWWLTARTVTDNDNVLPLSFLPMKQIWHRDLSNVEGDLKPWLQVLDREMESKVVLKAKPQAMLQQATNTASGFVGKPVKLSELLTSAVFKDRLSASMPQAEDVVLTMFLWHVE
jgi:hypothetical protein